MCVQKLTISSKFTDIVTLKKQKTPLDLINNNRKFWQKGEISWGNEFFLL